MHLDVAAKLLAQFSDAAEGVSVEGSSLELSEPAFDGVQPGRAGRREVDVVPGVTFEPGLDCRGRVRAAVIENEVNVEVAWRHAVDLPQEGQELLRTVLAGHPTDDVSGRDVKRRVQTGGAMALVVVGPSFHLPGT